MKDKILNVIMGISILALIGAGYREYPIHNGKLTSDLNANGYSITNLPAWFFPAETDPTVPSWAKEAAPPSETDPYFHEWVGGVTNERGVISAAESAMFAYTLGGPAEEVSYSAGDITAAIDDLREAIPTTIGAAIANTNPAFSNAVLSVGLGIDTNTVAVINALVEAGDELPIGGAATVGALLLALATAVAALKRTKADASALRYAMPESVALVAENDAATLVCADRAVTNATIASGFSTLNLTFPAAVSGYVRDFYLRITVAAGESAPAISVPQGITIENAGGAVPEIADGEASAAATTLVWFSETAPGIFTAKGETVKAVA